MTSAQVDEALGPLSSDVDYIDYLELLLPEIERSGLFWKNENAGPPVIPPDYPGLRLVKGGPA